MSLFDADLNLSAPKYGETKVKSPNCIILWSSSSNNPNSKLSAQNLASTLLSRGVRLEQLDGTKTENKKLRNQLCKISKKRSYPQVFIKQEYNQIKFIGVDSDVNFLLEIDAQKFDDTFGCCVNTETAENTANAGDKKQKALRFKILAEQWLDAGNLFKAQKFARKWMRLEDSEEVKALLDRIQKEQAIRHQNVQNEQQNEILDIVIDGDDDDDTKAEVQVSVTESMVDFDIENGTQTANDDLVNTILEQSVCLQQKNEELEKENKLLREQLAAAQNIDYERKKIEVKRGCCYECKEVEEYNYKKCDDIKIRSGVESSQLDSNNKMNVHKSRLDEWDKHTEHLNGVFCGNEGKDNVDDGDEVEMKEEEAMAVAMDVSSLYLLYVECMELLKEQQQRTEDVMTHCMDLNSETTNLKSIIKIYNEDVPSTKSKYDALCVAYNSVKQEREDVQEKVRNLVIEINNMIDSENTQNHDKCVTLDKFNLLRMELDEYEKLLLESRSLTKQYSQFEDNVERKSGEFKQYFVAKWNKHESAWMQWDVNGIIVWFKHLMHDNKIQLSKGFDLNNVQQKMIEQQICGASLHKMDKAELKLSGFHIFDDRDQIYEMICALVETYPMPMPPHQPIEACLSVGDQTEGSILNNIPQEYKDPISGAIMKDPWVAYDNKTYEKTNIVHYIQKHGRAPDSLHKCDPQELDAMVRNKQLKTRIEQFLKANPQITAANGE